MRLIQTLAQPQTNRGALQGPFHSFFLSFFRFPPFLSQHRRWPQCVTGLFACRSASVTFIMATTHIRTYICKYRCMCPHADTHCVFLENEEEMQMRSDGVQDNRPRMDQFPLPDSHSSGTKRLDRASEWIRLGKINRPNPTLRRTDKPAAVAHFFYGCKSAATCYVHRL